MSVNNNTKITKEALMIYWQCVCVCLGLPLSVDLRIAMNFCPSSTDDAFLASAKASRLPFGVKVINGIL